MKTFLPTHTPRLLAAFGALTLLAAAGLVASSRPAHTAGGAVAVNVANLPLPTTGADNPANQPFQYDFQTDDDNQAQVSQAITVPAHKRLVIEYISSELNQYNPNVGGYVYLSTVAGGYNNYYYLTGHIKDGGRRNQSLRLYADPGSTVTIGASSNDGVTKGIGTDTEVSGYYVNVP